jgi:hypothetical protein
MQIEVLRTFLKDPEIKAKYKIDDEHIDSINMTVSEPNIMITLVKELIVKQAEAPSINVAAAQLNTVLDHRLK